MKKLIAIVIAIIAVLAMTVPVMAADTSAGTGVTISLGTNPPIIKCKWEQEPITELESGDPSHLTPFTQINPPLVHMATKPIEYFAVITDEEEGGNILQAFAYVFHPDGSPAPYNADVAPGGPYFKYKVVFTNLGHDAAAIAKVNAANAAGLIKFDPRFNIAEITGTDGEMPKGNADLWYGTELIDFEQPAGDYRVEVYGVDHASGTSVALENYFLYVPLSQVEVDFTSINYGSVAITIEKTIAGDLDWDGPPPIVNNATVRNIGNTWAHVKVGQDDMGFGKETTSPTTAYKGNRAPVGDESNWYVYFDCRMGNNPANEMWYDPTAKGSAITNIVTLPNYLALSWQDELDFSICVKNGMGAKSGSMVIGSSVEPFTSPLPVGGVPSH